MNSENKQKNRSSFLSRKESGEKECFLNRSQLVLYHMLLLGCSLFVFIPHVFADQTFHHMHKQKLKKNIHDHQEKKDNTDDHRDIKKSLFSDSDLSIKQAWVRLPAKGKKTTAAYLHIMNKDRDLNLVGIKTSISDKTSLHQSVYENHIAKMLPVDFIQLKSNTEFVMKPAGYHIMLVGLKKSLEQGEKIDLTLIFKDKKEIIIPAIVRDGLNLKSEHSHHH